jgi:hypothetical protein
MPLIFQTGSGLRPILVVACMFGVLFVTFLTELLVPLSCFSIFSWIRKSVVTFWFISIQVDTFSTEILQMLVAELLVEVGHCLWKMVIAWYCLVLYGQCTVSSVIVQQKLVVFVNVLGVGTWKKLVWKFSLEASLVVLMFCLVQFYVAGIYNLVGLWLETVEPYLF